MNDESNTHLRKISTGAGIIFVGIIISKLLGYIYRIIVARIGIEEYGLLNLAIGIIGIITILSLLGLNEGILRYIPFYLGKKDKIKIKYVIRSALKISIILSLFFSILLFIFSDKVTSLFRNPELSFILKLLIITIPLDTIRSIFFNALIGFQKVRYFIYSKNLIESITKIVFTILFLYLGFNLLGAVFAYILAILISTLTSFYFLQKKVFPFIKSGMKSINAKRELLRYSWPLALTSIFIYILGWIDTFMIGYFKNISDIGIFNAALPTAALLYIIPLTITTTFFPVATQIYSENKKEIFKSIYKTITKWLFLINIYPLIFFLIFSKEILTFIFGIGYNSGYLVLIIISVGYFINFVLKSSEKALLIIEKSRLILINLIVAGILNIILNYILIPIYGINGAAIATASSYILISFLLYIENMIFIKINPFKKAYIRIMISIIPVIFILISIKQYIYNIYLLMGSFFILLIVYSILLLFTKSFEREDIFVVSMLQQKTGLKLHYLNKIIKKFL